MRLVDIEKDLKNLIINEASDTEIYEKIYELVYRFLKYKKALFTDFEYEEVAAIGAEDLYLKMHNGTRLTSWIGYINLSHFSYIREFRKKYSSEIISTKDNPELADGVTLMSAASLLQNPLDFLKSENLQYIESGIEKTIDDVLDNSIFLKYTSEYYNAKISIILSILLGKFVIFGTEKKNKNYIHILYVLVKDNVIKNIGFGNNNLSESLRQYAIDYFYVEDCYEE